MSYLLSGEIDFNNEDLDFFGHILDKFCVRDILFASTNFNIL